MLSFDPHAPYVYSMYLHVKSKFRVQDEHNFTIRRKMMFVKSKRASLRCKVYTVCQMFVQATWLSKSLEVGIHWIKTDKPKRLLTDTE